jgi:hypothetical protein
VFNTRWAEWTVVRAEAQCEPFRKDPNLLSYYLDNEVSHLAPPRSPPSL